MGKNARYGTNLPLAEHCHTSHLTCGWCFVSQVVLSKSRGQWATLITQSILAGPGRNCASNVPRALDCLGGLKRANSVVLTVGNVKRLSLQGNGVRSREHASTRIPVRAVAALPGAYNRRYDART